MAAISRRPRLAQIAVLAVSLIAAACSLLKPTESVLDKQEHAARLAHEGKHAEAARLYADLAMQVPAESDNYELLSAEQWATAGNVAAAKQALAQVSPEARTKLAIPRALVTAEIAYAENDPARAIRELDQAPVPTSPEQAQKYCLRHVLGVRGVAGDPVRRAKHQAVTRPKHPLEFARDYDCRFLCQCASQGTPPVTRFSLLKTAGGYGYYNPSVFILKRF